MPENRRPVGIHGAAQQPDSQEVLSLIASGLEAIEHSPLPKAAQRELTGMFVDNLRHDAVRRHAELLLILRVATGDRQAG